MIEKLFDEIGKAYAENKKQYPDYLVMTHTTYGMVMYGKIPEEFPKKALDRDNHTILGIRVIFDEKSCQCHRPDRNCAECRGLATGGIIKRENYLIGELEPLADCIPASGCFTIKRL